MKNILLGAFFMLILLPPISYGANQTSVVNPQVAACLQQVSAENTAFWSGQAQERDAFGKANPNALASHDKHWSAMHAIDMAQRTGKPTAGLPTPPVEDPTFASFLAKQQGDKVAFLQKLNQDTQNCLNLGTGTNTTVTTSTGT